ncbi:MAG: ATP-binding cassette domain-containing protein [Candidatus Dormibacteraeota bacterium]|nr:ATP-binding cassette domain-containing protein [Candidatus Dormibacteraeota bacterium]
MATLTVRGLSYWYPGVAEPALRDLSLQLEPGLTLVVGPSGGGKSTLLRLCNGLVPHLFGGRIQGSAEVLGEDILRTPTRQLARRVGFVFQDPERQAVFDRVDREVAFGLENVGLPAREMPARVEEALSRVGAAHLAGRRLGTLSGGERQRVAIASALVLEPACLVLDEPASQLDPEGAERVLDACLELASGGTTVVVAEHRLERLLPAANRLVAVSAGGATSGPPEALYHLAPALPGVVELGRRLGWRPPALSPEQVNGRLPTLREPAPASRRPAAGPAVVQLDGVSAGMARAPVLRGCGLGVGAGEVVCLMGPNGGGKTTLLRTLAGLLPPRAGTVRRQPGRIAYLPQRPDLLLHRPTVRDEVLVTLRRSGGDLREAEHILGVLGLEVVADRFPRDLSTGQRQRAGLAAVLAGAPRLALLDEPTRGMDPAAMAALQTLLRELRDRGGGICVATHDPDLAARIADRVVLVRDGALADLGPPESALAGSGPYSTQLGRLYPAGPVTVEGVLARL